MKRQEVMEFMQRYLDNDLSDEEYAALMAQLEQDRASKEMFERMLKLSDDLAKLPKVTPPYSIVDSIIPKLDQLEQTTVNGTTGSVGPTNRPAKKSRSHRKIWGGLLGSAACAVILGIALHSWLDHSVQTADDGSGAPAVSDEAAVLNAESDSIRSEAMLFSSATEQDEQAADIGSSSPAESNPDAGDVAGASAIRAMPNSKEDLNSGPAGNAMGMADGEQGEAVAPHEGREQMNRDATIGLDQPDAVISGYNEKAETAALPSPDGNKTAFIYWEGTQVHISIAKADHETYVSDPVNADEINYYWSDDGQTFTYTVITGNKQEEIQVDAESGIEIRN